MTLKMLYVKIRWRRIKPSSRYRFWNFSFWFECRVIKDIYTLKPYGQSNSAPLFLYRNLRVQAVRTIGDGKHLKLVLKDKNKYIDVVGFSQGEKEIL